MKKTQRQEGVVDQPAAGEGADGGGDAGRRRPGADGAAAALGGVDPR